MEEEPQPFLTARWEDLALITYRIPADMLFAALPAGLEPDRMEADGEDVAYVSLVSFRFLDTKVKGIAVPLHRDFPEVNLRAYVREIGAPHRRGVVFIAELVPKPAITAVANIVYHEQYRTVPMTSEARDLGEDLREHDCRIEIGDRVHRICIRGRRPPETRPPGSVEHFFKEHTWGFGRDLEGNAVVYRVDHPVWEVYPCTSDDLELDLGFGELYGSPWGWLDDQAPFHVAYAVGSEIAVYPRDE